MPETAPRMIYFRAGLSGLSPPSKARFVQFSCRDLPTRPRTPMTSDSNEKRERGASESLSFLDFLCRLKIRWFSPSRTTTVPFLGSAHFLGWQRKRFKCYAGNPTGMDAWRQDKLTTISKALGNIDNRASKLVNRINTSPVGTWHSDKRVASWTDEVARLQDMSDRLLGFKGKLYIYSDLAYIEAVREWENEVQKICKRADALHKEKRKATK